MKHLHFFAAPKGFSLVELMIASLIFVTGGIGIIGALIFALSVNQTARIDSVALHLSQQKLEELKGLRFDDARLAGPGCALDSDSNIDFYAAADSGYAATASVSVDVARTVSMAFETRWNITEISGKKIITVATNQAGTSSAHSHPVNLRIARAP